MIEYIGTLMANYFKVMKIPTDKSCKACGIILTSDNRAGKRLSCKPCRVKVVMAWKDKNRKAVNARIRDWMFRTGRVKTHPCETCATPCIKRYTRSFCSDKCRLLSYVKVVDGCWLWKGAKNRTGYGKMSFRGNKTMPVHRASYVIFKGDIPDDKFVCHGCDNPSCFNPDHLWIGTTQDNKKDQLKKDRGGVKLK